MPSAFWLGAFMLQDDNNSDSKSIFCIPLRQISGHFPEFVANLAFCRKHFNKKVRKKLE